MQLVAFTDYVYREHDGAVYADRAFALFLARLDRQPGELTIVGRLDPDSGPTRYRLPDQVRFVPLPHYSSLTRPMAVAGSLIRSLYRFWRVLDDADRVWLLGPYPHAIAFALLTRVRRRPLILGVRQDFPTYVRSRRPSRRWMHRAADLLEFIWRRLARRSPVIVVGPELASHYQHAPATLEITVSLVSDVDIEAGERAAARAYDGELRLLSVGRIDREKNPLLLADTLAALRAENSRWRLIVCGEGPLMPLLARRLRELSLSEHVELRGYVPLGAPLLELYRSSHVFLHVSWTEGMPQVLTEAFASGIPVVATAVGGVEQAAGGPALMIAPGSAGAAAAAVEQLARDAPLRRRLVASGFERARVHTLEREIARVSGFIATGGIAPTSGEPPRSRAG